MIFKGDFWKLRKRLLPKSHSIPHVLQDQSGCGITDPINIQSEDLEGHMNSQNKICSLRLEVSKAKLDDEVYYRGI